MKLIRKLHCLNKRLMGIALCVCMSAIFSLYHSQRVVAKSSDHPPIVVLDPGHGMPDPGAVRGELYEKDINLKIALEVSRLLNKQSIQVCLTRTDDNDLADSYEEKRGRRHRHRADLQRRLTVIREAGPDAVISIHCNWARNQSAQGALVLFHRKNEEGERLAQQIFESFHRANIQVESSPSFRRLYLLRHIEEPCVLIEVGFLSNKAEAKRLSTPEYQERLALAIETGVRSYLGEYNPNHHQEGLRSKFLNHLDRIWRSFIDHWPFTKARF